MSAILMGIVVCQPLQAQDESGAGEEMADFFGGPTVCYESPDSEYIPDNEIAERYQQARMAFVFGRHEYAYSIWKPLADIGYADAEASIGWMYHTGQGFPKDLNKALEWYRRAADKFHPIAMNNIGVLFEQGIDGRRDVVAAAKWYRESASVGYRFAQYNLGLMYRDGNGVETNLDEALYWLQLAALQGVKQAETALAELSSQARSRGDRSAPHLAQDNVKLPDAVMGMSWLRERDPKHFTIQLARSDNLHWLLTYAATLPPSGMQVAYYRYSVSGKDWHNLVYGDFKTRDEAKQVVDGLPESARKFLPWPRRIGDIHELIND